MTEFEYNEHPLFELGNRLHAPCEPTDSLLSKLYFVNWFFCIIDCEGLRSWAQAGSESTLYVRDCLRQAGVTEFADLLDAWINAIPGGLEQIDEAYSVVDTPACEELDQQTDTLFRREGARFADLYLAWHRAQT